MNETLINTINSINSIGSQKNIENSMMDKNSSRFDKVLDKTSKTLGDVKDKYSIVNTEKNVNFKKILQEATDEANVETSLDLTLARDVQEVIAQFQKIDKDEEDIVEKLEVFAQLTETSDLELTANNTIDFESVENVSLKSLYKSLGKEVEEVENTDNELEIDEDILKELNIESIKAEVDNGSDSSDLMNNQSPQEQAVKALMNHDGASFDSKIQQAQETVQTTNKAPTEVNPSKIIEQVTKQLEGMQNSSKVSIVLNPEALGKVTIHLVKSAEGLSAQFTTMTQEAKEILSKGLDGLKEALTSQGINADTVSVKLNETQKSEYNSDWTDKEGSRGGNKEQQRSNKDEKNKEQFEKTMEEQVAV